MVHFRVRREWRPSLQHVLERSWCAEMHLAVNWVIYIYIYTRIYMGQDLGFGDLPAVMENQREKELKSEMDTVLLQVECYGILGQARIKAGSLGLGFRGLSQEGHLSWDHLLSAKPLTETP